MSQSFTERHGYEEPVPAITVREGDPGDFRGVLVDIAYESGLSAKGVRNFVCKVLRVAADPDNFSESWVDNEVRDHLRDCKWTKVYEVVEEICKATGSEGYFSEEINKYFRDKGIGYQVVKGRVEFRGSEAFEVPVRGALEELAQSGRATAHSELGEALRDISRRPEPDVTGAVQHSMAALECLARDISGRSKDTLGDIAESHPELFPRPLEEVVKKLWGFSSNKARHLKEGGAVEFEEAELVVHTASALCSYLIHKFDDGSRSYPAHDLDDLPFD